MKVKISEPTNREDNAETLRVAEQRGEFATEFEEREKKKENWKKRRKEKWDSQDWYGSNCVFLESTARSHRAPPAPRRVVKLGTREKLMDNHFEFINDWPE